MAKRRSDDDDAPKKKKKKKAAPREEDEDLDDDADDDAPLPRKKSGPGNDAYVGLLAITLLALIATSVLFYLDHSELSAQPVQAPAFTVPSLGGASPAAPAAGTPAPGAPAVPMPKT